MSKGRASHALGSNRDGADYGHDFFKRSLRMHTWGTTIRCQGRSRASEAGHLREFGFQPSFEASSLMIDHCASFFASVPRADVSGKNNSRPFIFCSRSAGMAYSRIARIFESNRDREFFAFPQENVLDPGLNEQLAGGFIVRLTHVEIEMEAFQEPPVPAQAAAVSAFAGATRGSLPARDEHHAIPR